MASGPGRTSVRDRLHPSFRRLFRTGGYKRRGGHQHRNSRRTSGPQKRSARKNAMGKLQTTVWSQEGTNSIPRLLEDHRSP